ncbi:MAG: hypothetical protein EOM73_16240, partial [Bacteroidia bacterium]|nr:hypothetical protein [Bacteroidia bacterium]
MFRYFMIALLFTTIPVFSQDFNVDNTFTHWKQNKSNWIKPFGICQVILNNGQAQLSVEATPTSPAHLFTTTDYPVKINDHIEVEIIAKGRGSAEFGIYFGNASGTTLGLDRFNVKVTGESTVYKHLFTVRPQGKNIADRIHIFVGAAKNSAIVIEKISARLTDCAATEPRYPLDAEGNVLLDSFSNLQKWSTQQKKYPQPELVAENG